VELFTENIIAERPGAVTRSGLPFYPVKLPVANEAVDILITEGGEDFYNYLKRIGLAKDPGLIVLSSQHNYYYDSEEMDSMKTVVNLTEFNRIKQIKSLLHSHLHFLPKGCNFIGCFENNKKVERYTLSDRSGDREKKGNFDLCELGILSRYPFINMLYSMMDSKTNAYMSEESVILMLGIHGFKVMDMTEFKGLTYFHSIKTGKISN
jgi:hypothetical protein